jgi:hypothetical protein
MCLRLTLSGETLVEHGANKDTSDVACSIVGKKEKNISFEPELRNIKYLCIHNS